MRVGTNGDGDAIYRRLRRVRRPFQLSFQSITLTIQGRGRGRGRGQAEAEHEAEHEALLW